MGQRGKQMKYLMLFLVMSSAALGAPRTVVDETFKTTFSDYNQLNKMIRCEPGYRGGYATGDTLILQSHTIELGFDVSNQPFRALSFDALNREARRLKLSRRPYAEGCEPAMEAFRKVVQASERVEVTVHRTVSVWVDSGARVDRKVDGEVQAVRRFQREVYFELFTVEIAGFEFTLGQSLNGVAGSL
jgi:hypothetical protein